MDYATIRKFFGAKELLGLCAVLSLSLLALSAARAGAQGVPPAEICNGKDDDGDGVVDDGVNCDHYLSYLLDKSITPISVVLRDQFLSPTDFTLVLIERLLNPVRKTHAGAVFNPRRPDLHYLAYRVQTQAQFTPRPVFIQNQFEQRTILATKPRYLLTPTGKKKIGIPDDKLSNLPAKAIAAIVPKVPENANHYLCYDVEPYNLAKGVLLRDQFQNRQFEVIKARYLCNPVEKRHNEKVYNIVDEKNHLMCYEVIPHNTVNRPVLTHDQFGVKGVKAVRTEEVCLPTVKTLLPTECIPQNETCNGIDDDCDGAVDDVPDIGSACTGGGTNTTGACTAKFACTGSPGPGPNGLTCTQDVGPAAEVCNNIDDDCDGSTDEFPAACEQAQ